MNEIKVVCFDLAQVLVDWNPAPLLRRRVPGEKEFQAFFPDFLAWSETTCRGGLREHIPDLIRQHPEHREWLEEYPDFFLDTVVGIIEGTALILKEVKRKGFQTFAGSNWPKDAFSMAADRLPFLADFDGLHISGEIGIVKPDPAFFQTMAERFGFKPEEALFIDDNPLYLEGAQTAGMHPIHFTTPARLLADLEPYTGPLSVALP